MSTVTSNPTDLVVPFCTVVAVDTSNLWYWVCGKCEKAVTYSFQAQVNKCKSCLSSSFKRAFRLLLSVASDSKVMVVICFDRLAKVLMGCSADEFFHFESRNPFAVENVAKFLEGQLFRLELRNSTTGNAQHMRVSSIVPLASDFQPVIKHLKKSYK